MEARYSDFHQIVCGKNGTVIDFLQLQKDNLPITVARIGMSNELAAEVVKMLERILDLPKERRKS